MKRARGLTLVEVMVTLAVIGILLAMAAPSLSDMINRRRTLAVAEQLMTDIAYARAETGLRNQALSITFNKDASQTCYTMYYARAARLCNCTGGQGRACTYFNTVYPDMEVRTVKLPTSQGVTVIPDPLQWASDNADRTLNFVLPQLIAMPADAVVDIRGTSGAHLRLQVNQMGRVSMCSAEQNFAGVAPCPP